MPNKAELEERIEELEAAQDGLSEKQLRTLKDKIDQDGLLTRRTVLSDIDQAFVDLYNELSE